MNNFDELPMVDVVAAVPTQVEGVLEANHDKTPDINESSEAAAADNDHDMDLNLPLLFSNNLLPGAIYLGRVELPSLLPRTYKVLYC